MNNGKICPICKLCIESYAERCERCGYNFIDQSLEEKLMKERAWNFSWNAHHVVAILIGVVFFYFTRNLIAESLLLRIVACFIVATIADLILYFTRLNYYKNRQKRRASFLSSTVQDSPLGSSVVTESGTNNGIRGGTLPPVKYCHKCGFELLKSSDFCSQCGTKICTDDGGSKQYINNKAIHISSDYQADNSAERILNSPKFESAYSALSKEQKERFFLLPDRKFDAARVVHSLLQVVGHVSTMPQLLEIYITVLARLITSNMPPERIAVTLNMRYSDILNEEQQYIVIAFAEAHINGKNQGFYIRNEQDVKEIMQTARNYQETASTQKGVSESSDYGFSADNPIRVQSLPAEYRYLDCLVYDNGTIIEKKRIACVDNANGDMIDYFLITVAEKGAERKIALYFDGYAKSQSRVAPHGFHLK